ncbi:MAG: hypothetical protein ACRCUY_10235 [Thermoguttaceae bacterium]
MIDIPKPTRICGVTGREMLPGDFFFSVLEETPSILKRLDFSEEAWTGPPNDNYLGWWKTQVPNIVEKKSKLAPNEVLFQLFEELALESEKSDMRYVVALLLIRRRVLRFEREDQDETGQKMLVVYAIKENALYQIPVIMPDDERLENIQNQLAELLYK